MRNDVLGNPEQTNYPQMHILMLMLMKYFINFINNYFLIYDRPHDDPEKDF